MKRANDVMDEVVQPLFSALVGVGVLILLGMLAGCYNDALPDTDDDSMCEKSDPEIVTIVNTVTLTATAGRVTATCEDDQHVVRGWCVAYSAGGAATQAGQDFGPYGTDDVPLAKRVSMHAPREDGWTCGGEAIDMWVRLAAHVECETGGGMRTEPQGGE